MPPTTQPSPTASLTAPTTPSAPCSAAAAAHRGRGWTGHQPPIRHGGRTRDGGGVPAEHLLGHVPDCTAAHMPVLVERRPILGRAAVWQERSPAVLTALEVGAMRWPLRRRRVWCRPLMDASTATFRGAHLPGRLDASPITASRPHSPPVASRAAGYAGRAPPHSPSCPSARGAGPQRRPAP